MVKNCTVVEGHGVDDCVVDNGLQRMCSSGVVKDINKIRQTFGTMMVVMQNFLELHWKPGLVPGLPEVSWTLQPDLGASPCNYLKYEVPDLCCGRLFHRC